MALSDETKEQLAALSESLLQKDPKEFKRLIKKNYPEMSIPEIEIEEQQVAAKQELDEKYSKIETSVNEIKGTLNVLLTRQDLEKKGRSIDEIKAIEEKIKSKEAPNYAVAEKLFEYDRLTAPPPPRERIAGRGPAGLTEEKLKGLKEDPIGWARNEAIEAMNDIHSGKVKINPGGYAG